MSLRAQSKPSVASKTAFELLAAHGDSEEEVESSDQEQEDVLSAPATGASPTAKAELEEKPRALGTSKGAQKRAARAAARLQEQQQLQQQGQQSTPTTSSSYEEKTAIRSGATANGPTSPVGERRRSRSPPATKSTFQPDLPPLPEPTSSPIVRKRKAAESPTLEPFPKETRMDEVGEATVQTTPADEKAKKLRNAGTRTLWTFIMIGGFIALLVMGHVYMMLLVLLCQTVVYREVTSLFTLRHTPDSKDDKDPWSKTLNWYFFVVANYFLYGESIIYYFKHVMFAGRLLLPFATNHRLISFMLYIIGFMGFVGSLKKDFLLRQFGLFCWVHMSLLLIVVSSHFIVNNILEGIIWFWVPASLVICNDVFAYIWGVTLGRTPLIKLSPKKTVEGFVGAFFSTLIFGVVWGTIFMRYNYMICPVKDLGASAFSNITCTPNHVFVWREWEIPTPFQMAISSMLGTSVTTIPYATYQFHVLVMATFASLVAPFGGFFASGFKRAFNIKDFGDSIPGHGGMTDRMDCQFLMGLFSYVYFSSLIREHHVTVGSVLQTIVSGLTVDEQLELFMDLKRYLEGQGVEIKAAIR